MDFSPSWFQFSQNLTTENPARHSRNQKNCFGHLNPMRLSKSAHDRNPPSPPLQRGDWGVFRGWFLICFILFFFSVSSVIPNGLAPHLALLHDRRFLIRDRLDQFFCFPHCRLGERGIMQGLGVFLPLVGHPPEKIDEGLGFFLRLPRSSVPYRLRSR